MKELFMELFSGFSSIGWKELVMFLVGIILIYLAIKKEYEPMLLLPIGFGCILVNLPFSVVWETMEKGESIPGFLQILHNSGIQNDLFPVLIFIGVGAMIDFTPLFKNPIMIFFGAAAQFGIFATMLAAVAFGFDLPVAAAIGIIGAADGPTAIYVGNKFAPEHFAAISVAAYSYMALVPIIQPPVIRLCTTKKERLIRMDYHEEPVPRVTKIIFPISITLIAGLLVPNSAPLVGSLMFGNLVRECGVLERLSKTAQNELANLVTLLLGITIGGTMKAANFLTLDTIKIMTLGLVAFIFDTAGGVYFAKFINLFLKKKINPMIGGAGISAFPMSSRVIQKMAQKEDPTNFE